MSEWRRYRKDLKKRAKTAMETSRQLLVAKARIVELEADAASTLLRHRSELEQLTADRDSWKQLSGELAEQRDAAKDRAADTALRLRVLEDAVRSAAKLLPDRPQPLTEQLKP